MAKRRQLPRSLAALFAAPLALAACGDDHTVGQDLSIAGAADAAALPDSAPGPDLPSGRLRGEPRSSAIAISDDDRVVAAVSPDDDLLYLIDTSDHPSRMAVPLGAGCEPHAVAYAPDGSFFVACRKQGTVVQVRGAAGMHPAAGAPIPVGAEPTAILVTPSGGGLVVANYADGTVTLHDLARARSTVLAVGPNPRAVAMTNSGSGDDTKETLYVTLMFGQPVGGNAPSEGSDVGRQGQVVPVSFANGLAAATVGTPIALAPIADTTFKVLNKTSNQSIPVGAYPNQLQAIALHGGRGYVPSTAASPAGPVHFDGNVHPFVSVFDLGTGRELPFGPSGQSATTGCGSTIAANTVGYAAGTLDLAVQVRDLDGAASPAPVLMPTIPVDLAFVPGSDVGYVLSMASDEVLRVAWDYSSHTACAGSAVAKAVNLQAVPGDVKVPIGIVARNDGTAAYVNAWVGREVEVIDLASQSVTARVPLSPQPSQPAEASVQAGKKFFWTATGRWSKNGFGSCGACHVDGLADNVTWVFNAGPRQTIALDATFAKAQNGVPDPTDQRILNWTAVNDELHDLETNTRGASGGLGAIVSDSGNPIDLTGNSGVVGSAKQLADDGMDAFPTLDKLTGLPTGRSELVDTATSIEWDQLESYVVTIRSQSHPAGLDPRAPTVMSGFSQFLAGGCTKCHAGLKWSNSRRPTPPTRGGAPGATTCAMETTPLAKQKVPTAGAPKPQNVDPLQLETEPTRTACAVDADCAPALVGAKCVGGNCRILPARLTCALRDVGTFGAGPLGPAFEVKQTTDASGKGQTAQGAAGFNSPGLLSLAESAPYLHNGAAQTLTDLLANPAFHDHLTSGNPAYAPDQAAVADLVHFLLSIDTATPAPATDAGFDLCTGSYAPNQKACTNP